jgi:hypothetical protein
MREAARRLATACVLTCGIAALTASAAAAAPVVDENYLPFKHCPIENKTVKLCVVAITTSGEFKMGSKTVTIEHPVVLQGGLTGNEGFLELVPPTDGAPVMEAPPMKVPGGLTGIEGVGEEVTATTELTGPVILNVGNEGTRQGVATLLPLRVKLNNSVLGKECIVGSAAEPLLLQLTTGTTSPPPPNTPISGAPGTLSLNEEIDELHGVSLVDNSFAAPGVNGCGESLAPVLDPVVDLSAGLPSASGKNTAILNGSVLLTSRKAVKKSKVEKKPKVKKEKGM